MHEHTHSIYATGSINGESVRHGRREDHALHHQCESTDTRKESISRRKQSSLTWQTEQQRVTTDDQCGKTGTRDREQLQEEERERAARCGEETRRRNGQLLTGFPAEKSRTDSPAENTVHCLAQAANTRKENGHSTQDSLWPRGAGSRRARTEST